jgi:ABC-2 type transport system permease protein
MISALVIKTWRDHWKGTLGWALGIFSITAMELLIYPTIRKAATGISQLLDNMPSAMKTMFRMTDYTSGPGFLAAELFSFTLPLIFIAIGASAGARATAEEESTGTADLLLALPLSRTRIILSKVFASLAILAAISALLAITLIIGTNFEGLSVSTSGLIAASAEVGLLGALFMSISLLVGALTGRKGIALGLAMAVAVAAYLLYSLAPLVKALDRWLPVNPFQWTVGNDPIRNGMDRGYAITLLLITICLILSAVVAFNRRDISS